MSKPTPQQEVILSHLRSGKWVCGSKWLNGIKDDRARISSLNKGYLATKNYKIIGEPCRGRYCGRTKCPLDARKAVPIENNYVTYARELVRRFEANEPVFV